MRYHYKHFIFSFLFLFSVATQLFGQCNPPIVTIDTHVSCGPYTWPNNGVTYPFSNHLATDTIFNGAANGCDSIVILNLTVSHNELTTDVVYSPTPYTWIDGVTYSSSNNTASVTLTNAAGCDSVVHLDLTITPIQSNGQIDTTICFGDTLFFGGETYSTAGTYYDSISSVTTAPKTVSYSDTIAVSSSTNAGYGWGRPTLYFDYTSAGAAVPYGGGEYSLMRLDAPFWSGNGNVNNSIVNQIGVWSNGVPTAQWYGSTFTVNIPESKTYYVMLVGDNSFRFSLDGVIQITSDPNQIIIAEPRNPATTVTFTWLHIYPFYLTKGCHTITLEGRNDGGPGMFGGVILNNTDVEIANATQNSDLNYLFSTANVTTFYSSDPPTYSCPPGMSPLGPTMCDECIEVEGQYVEINLNINPVLTESYSDTICFGDTLNLHGFSYFASGTYQDTLQNANGCDSLIYTLDLTVISNMNLAGNDTTICEGESIALTANAPNNAIVSWNNGIFDGIAFTPTNTATYIVIATIGACVLTDSVTVVVNPPINVGYEANPQEGEPPLNVTFENTTPGNNTYFWDLGDGNGFVQNNDTLLTHIYKNSGLFYTYLAGENSFGCKDTTSIVIKVNTPDMSYGVPNVFTPNNDNDNDFFKLIDPSNVQKIEIIILNRWGNLVFESNDVFFKWNGKNMNSGKPCTEGVYFYKIELTDLKGKIVEEDGNITLVRDKK